MGEVEKKIKETPIYLQSAHYILIDPDTVEKQPDGTFTAVGERKVAGFLFGDPTIEHVIVKYNPEGKFIELDTAPEDKIPPPKGIFDYLLSFVR